MKKTREKTAPVVKAKTPLTPRAAAAFLVSLVLLSAITAAFIAVTLERNKVYQTGIAIWESMAKSSPNKRRTHENYGQALSTAGRLHEALREFQTVLSLPDDGSVPLRDVYREIGVVYFRLGAYEDSITAWRKGLVHAPLDPGLLNNLAIALLRLQRYDEAISHAETATRNNELMPEPVNTLGEIHLARGDFSRAAAYFKRYIYLRPEEHRGYWNLAVALARSGNYDEAHESVQRFLSTVSDPRERSGAQELVNFIEDARKKKRK